MQAMRLGWKEEMTLREAPSVLLPLPQGQWLGEPARTTWGQGGAETHSHPQRWGGGPPQMSEPKQASVRLGCHWQVGGIPREERRVHGRPRGPGPAGPRLTPSNCLLLAVITLLIFLRRRLRKQARAQGKSTLEIHEQLVTYDEEGGGEMDTTSYDVSVLNSARHRGAKPPRPRRDVPPAVYAQVQKPPQHTPLTKYGEPGDMATVIEVKKDEADHDSSSLPYDTLHLFDYEGSESVAESLSSLGTHSSNSDIDYDFLNDWGPRFKMLAELYSTDSREELGY